jgi:hypothetical protein
MRQRIKGSIIMKSQNRFTALKNLDTKVDINITWETIKREYETSTKGSIGYYKLKKHSLTKGCLQLLDQREQAKLQDLQNPSEISVNGDNMNKMKKYLNDRLKSLQ